MKQVVKCPHCGYDDETLYSDVVDTEPGWWTYEEQCFKCDQWFRLSVHIDIDIEVEEMDPPAQNLDVGVI